MNVKEAQEALVAARQSFDEARTIVDAAFRAREVETAAQPVEGHPGARARLEAARSRYEAARWSVMAAMLGRRAAEASLAATEWDALADLEGAAPRRRDADPTELPR